MDPGPGRCPHGYSFCVGVYQMDPGPGGFWLLKSRWGCLFFGRVVVRSEALPNRVPFLNLDF